ncbi:MAG TPA: glycosyltransferase [Longimicrobiaceae bacterium]|nr:glycosyltransferase [Longimicrobiaceae bacterium]
MSDRARGRPYAIVAGDFVTTGGMDAANHALAAGIARRGRAVHLVAHRVEPRLAAVAGVHVHPVPRPLGSHLLGFPLLDRAGRSVAREIRSAGGVLIGNGGNVRGARAVWLHYVHAAYAPEMAGNPLRRTVSAWSRGSFMAQERAAVRGAEVVFANSERTGRDAVRLLGADPSAVRVAYYGADERFRPPSAEERQEARAALGWEDGRPVVLFVGALGARRKGFDTLFAAWSRLAATEGWDARLVVAGTGAELPAWRQRAADAGLGDAIHFAGFQSDVRRLLWGADALVSPTRYEAYGLAIQEALCCGLPCIFPRAAGVAERLAGEAAACFLLDDAGDADALAARMLRWRAAPAEWAALAAVAGERIRAWTWDDMAGQMLDTLDQLP